VNTRRNISDAERWGSMVAGAALTLYGLNRWRRGGWLLTAGGVYLFQRGKTGHCYTYDLLGVSTADDALAGRRTDMAVDNRVQINAIQMAALETLCEDDRLVRAD
jgi:uncharacterized membrane protein